MLVIHTKRMPNGKWSCYTTFQGYDYAFVSDSKEESQSQISEALTTIGAKKFTFLKEVLHEPKPIFKPRYMPPPRIDNQPFA